MNRPADRKRSLLRLLGVIVLSAALVTVGLWAMRLALEAILAPVETPAERVSGDH